MKGTKIIVIKLRELIKTALFITVGIILLIALIYLFMPKNADIPTHFPTNPVIAEAIVVQALQLAG